MSYLGMVLRLQTCILPVLFLVGVDSLVRGTRQCWGGEILLQVPAEQKAPGYEVLRREPSLVFRGHRDGASCIAVSADGKLVASGGMDKVVVVWSASTGKEVTRLKGFTSEVTSVWFSRDAKILAAASFDEVKTWEKQDFKELRSFRSGDSDRVDCKSFSITKDGKTAAVAYSDKTVRILDLQAGRTALVLDGHQHAIGCVSIMPDGSTVVSGSDDKTVRIWDVASGKLRTVIEDLTAPVTAMSISSDGKLVASGCWDGKLTIWSAETGKKLFACTGHTAEICSLGFSSDDKQLVSGSRDHSIRVWDVTKRGKELLSSRQANGFFAVAFSQDLKIFASSAFDAKLRVWGIPDTVESKK